MISEQYLTLKYLKMQTAKKRFEGSNEKKSTLQSLNPKHIKLKNEKAGLPGILFPAARLSKGFAVANPPKITSEL